MKSEQNDPQTPQRATRKPKSRLARTGLVVMLIGIAILLYSMYLVLSGPQHVMINVFTGPTFWQYLQTHPSQISIAGLACTLVGRVLVRRA